MGNSEQSKDSTQHWRSEANRGGSKSSPLTPGLSGPRYEVGEYGEIHYSTRPQRLLFHAPADKLAAVWGCKSCLLEKVRPERP